MEVAPEPRRCRAPHPIPERAARGELCFSILRPSRPCYCSDECRGRAKSARRDSSPTAREANTRYARKFRSAQPRIARLRVAATRMIPASRNVSANRYVRQLAGDPYVQERIGEAVATENGWVFDPQPGASLAVPASVLSAMINFVFARAPEGILPEQLVLREDMDWYHVDLLVDSSGTRSRSDQTITRVPVYQCVLPEGLSGALPPDRRVKPSKDALNLILHRIAQLLQEKRVRYPRNVLVRGRIPIWLGPDDEPVWRELWKQATGSDRPPKRGLALNILLGPITFQIRRSLDKVWIIDGLEPERR